MVSIVKNSIASRRSSFSEKGRQTRSNLTVFISAPEFVQPSYLPFESDVKMAICNLEIIGFNEPYDQRMYGADLLQAVQQAVDVDPVLRAFSKKYDIYYEDGESYFKN